MEKLLTTMASVAVRQRRRLGHAVGQPVIDLVRYQPDAVAPARGRDLGEARRRQHGAGRIGRACHDEPRDALRAVRRVDLCSRRHPAPRVVGDDRYRDLAQRRQDVAVAGISGRGQRHLGADIEQGKEGENEPRRGAGGHNHPLRLHGDAVALPVVAGDALAQGGQAQRHRVAQGLAFQRRRDAGQRRARCRCSGLPHLHMDDAVAERLPLGRGLHHVHHDERRDGAALRKAQARRRGSGHRPGAGRPAAVVNFLSTRLPNLRALKPPRLRPNRFARCTAELAALATARDNVRRLSAAGPYSCACSS